MQMVQSERWHETYSAPPQLVIGEGDDPASIEANEKRRRNLSYQNIKHMHDQLFRLVKTMGAEKAAQ